MSTAFDINSFLQNGLIYGGARPSKFNIIAGIPPNLAIPGFTEKLTFSASAASIPGFNMGQVQIPYFGRKIKTAGDRVWEDWQISVMLDEDYIVRAGFEVWNNAINSLVTNVMSPSDDNATGILSSPAGVSAGIGGTVPGIGSSITEFGEPFKSNWIINHYAKDGSNDIIRQYTLLGAWPRVIGPIDLDWGATDQIAKFSVLVSYDAMEPTIENTGSAKTASTPAYGDNT